MSIKEAELKAPRSRLEFPDGQAQWTIPAGKNWFALLFLPLWLIGWSIGGGAAIYALFTNFEPFIAIWLIGWALGWVYAASSLLWQIAGKEIIRIDGDRLVHGCRGLGWNRDVAYRAGEIRGLAADKGASFWEANSLQTPLIGFGRVGAIKFHYGARTIRMGTHIDEAEGRTIAEWLARHLPLSATEA